MSISPARRFWRHLSGYYVTRWSDLMYATMCAESLGQREPLNALVRKIGEDGDMQRREYLWLQSLEVTE